MTKKRIEDMTDEEFDAARRETERALTENERRMAYLRGQMEVHIEYAIRDDAETVEWLRAREWQRRGIPIVLRDGRPHSVPPGWPSGVDGEEVVSSCVEAYKRRYFEEREDLPEEQVTDSVKRFREAVGNDGGR